MNDRKSLRAETPCVTFVSVLEPHAFATEVLRLLGDEGARLRVMACWRDGDDARVDVRHRIDALRRAESQPSGLPS